MANKEEQKEHKDGIQLWIKRTGAFMGLIATAVTVFAGIHALVLQF